MMAAALALAGAGMTFPTRAAESPDAGTQATLREAEARGLQLFRHDRAISVAKAAFDDVRRFRRDRRVRGQVSETRGERVQVSFYGANDGGPVAVLYRVLVEADGRVSGGVQALAAPTALTAHESMAIRALDIAGQQAFPSCARSYRLVALPESLGADRWSVYLLAESDDEDVLPLGGSFRIDIDLSRQRRALQSFSQSCDGLDNGDNVFALLVNNALAATPSEIHVYWQHWSGKPMYLTHSDRSLLWLLEEGRISQVAR